MVESNSDRLRGIETGEHVVVGVNRFTETEPSPLTTGAGAIMVVDPAVEAEQIEKLKAWRATRDNKAVKAALADLESAAKEGRNVMEPSIACAKAGVTSGEWGGLLAPDLRRIPRANRRFADRRRRKKARLLPKSAVSVEAVSARLGRRIKFLVGKPGLDGHSNGAEQIAVRARDVGMEVVYEGIRLTPSQIVRAAMDESVHCVGLSILSGSHLPLVQDVMDRMRAEGMSNIPVIVGGIIPPEDEIKLKAMGVAAVYTPKNFKLNDIMADIVRIVAGEAKAA